MSRTPATNMPKGEAGDTVFVIDSKTNSGGKKSRGEYIETNETTDNEKHLTTYFESLTHMVKACFGTGILAIPSAFNSSGWVVGVIGTVIIGGICNYAFHVLLNAETVLKRKKKTTKNLTYYAIAQAAVEEGPEKLRWMAPYAPTLCKIFFAIGQLGTCCIYVVFISKNLKEIIDYYQDPKDRFDVQLYMVALIIPLVLIAWVRHLKYLAPFSVVGSVATLLSFGIIFYYIFQDLPPLSTIEPVEDGKGFIVLFSTVIFSMESIGVIIPLKNQMKKPELFGKTFGVMNAAMIPNLILFLTLGFFGYLKYGAEIKESIPLSLPNYEITARVSRLLLVLAIFISHPLQLYMAFDIVWTEFLEPRTKYYKFIKEYAVRTTLVLLTVVFAASIPHLNLFIALIGSLCYSTLGLTFPAIISLFAHWDDGNGLRFFFWSIQHMIIIFVGLSSLIVGSSTAVRDIAHELMA